MSLKEKISKYQIFDELSPLELEEIALLCEEKQFNRGEVIIEEDSKGVDMYIILDGRVTVEIKSYSAHPEEVSSQRLTTLREGDIIGEISFLEGKRRSAGAVAVDNISALRIEGEKLYGLFDKNPRLGYVVMRNIGRILAQRLCDINFRWRDNI